MMAQIGKVVKHLALSTLVILFVQNCAAVNKSVDQADHSFEKLNEKIKKSLNLK